MQAGSEHEGKRIRVENAQRLPDFSFQPFMNVHNPEMISQQYPPMILPFQPEDMNYLMMYDPSAMPMISPALPINYGDDRSERSNELRKASNSSSTHSSLSYLQHQHNQQQQQHQPVILPYPPPGSIQPRSVHTSLESLGYTGKKISKGKIMTTHIQKKIQDLVDYDEKLLKKARMLEEEVQKLKVNLAKHGVDSNMIMFRNKASE
jgi:hypothetical protein